VPGSARDDGRVKLWTVHRALQLRTRMAEVFRRGEYVAVEATKDFAGHVISFIRERRVLAVIPRFAFTLMEGKARLPLSGAWGRGELLVPQMAGMLLRNAFTGEHLQVGDEGTLPLQEVFAHFPVALFSAD